MSGFFDNIGKIFSGPVEEEPLASDVPEPLPATKPLPVASKPLPANSKVPSNKTVLTPRPLNPRNAQANSVSTTTAPLARANNTLRAPLEQSGGRRMRSKSKSLRSSLFRKYKYKMARRSMTMRKRCKKCGRKGCKGTCKGTRKARR